MQSLSSLDVPMWKLFGRAQPPKKGDIGIELELEGRLASPNDPWVYKEEGSLRGGGEYILASPVKLAGLKEALLTLQKTLDSCKPVISIRCSTHIHVNINELTARQIWQFCLAYYLIEPLLMRTQPDKRVGNLFCLGMEQAEAIFLDIQQDFSKSERPFKSFSKERNRYAALNLVAIGKFGSVEFRFFDAITDTRIIESWSRLLYNLVKVASGIAPMQLLKLYDELSPQEFLQMLLGEHANLVLEKFPNSSRINQLIHTNYDYVYELAHDLTNIKFEMPAHMWNEDLIDPDAPIRKKGSYTDYLDPHEMAELLQQNNPFTQPMNTVHIWDEVPQPIPQATTQAQPQNLQWAPTAVPFPFPAAPDPFDFGPAESPAEPDEDNF